MVLFMRQECLFPQQNIVHHGGDLAEGRRKSARPLSCKRPIHFVLKSRRRIYEKRYDVAAELQRQAKKFHIRIYDFAVAHDHLHFVARLPLPRALREIHPRPLRPSRQKARRQALGPATLFPRSPLGKRF
jgi:hypothetical protein